METREKLHALRMLMKEKELSAFIISPADPHQSEYPHSHWKTLDWFSGFTGSAGTLIVTHQFAGLWTDSRYFIQAEEELKGSGISLVKLKTPYAPEYIQWLADNISQDQVIGLDGNVFSQAQITLLKKNLISKGLKINCAFDLPGMIWPDRPDLPLDQIYEHKPGYTGMSRGEKMELVRQIMDEKEVTHHLLTALDDIAWLFNLRGSDVEYNPVFVSYALISKESANFFVDERKIPLQIAKDLKADGISLSPYTNLKDHLHTLETRSKLLLSNAKTSHHVFLSIPSHVEKTDDLSIPARLKAIKNETEIKNIRNAMIKDGVALVRFFNWFSHQIGKQDLNEISIAEKLRKFREEQEGYIGDSFCTIAGYKEHGAIVHYSAKEETAFSLKPEGILLLDSGAQYTDGTTDITRTVCLGKPTEEQINCYTLVLKGMINLSMAVFPEGTKGFQLDALARLPLWQQGKNYGHSTGHGIGYFLNVHEGPQGISPNPASNYPLMPGMIQSNEPGFYKEGEFGIRLENLIMVSQHQKTSFGKFLRFETLTLFPFEANLIDKEILTREEIYWINDYHQKVFETLSRKLGKEDNQWLLEKTKRI